MFFARVRWIGRVLEGAGIDTNSKTGRELSSTLITFSKYCQKKNRRGDGASGVRHDLGPAEWALLAAIVVSDEPKVTEHLSTALGLSIADISAILTRVQQAALELAKRSMPNILASMTGE